MKNRVKLYVIIYIQWCNEGSECFSQGQDKFLVCNRFQNVPAVFRVEAGNDENSVGKLLA